MKKLLITLSLMGVCSSAMAQLNSKEFVSCFVKAANEVIQEYKDHGTKSQRKRICNELSQQYIDRMTAKFSEIHNGRIVYYSAESMAQEHMIDIYNYISDDMDCYGNAIEGQNGSLVGALINSGAYRRNLHLTDATLDKMTGINLWGHFFGKSHMYDSLGELDFSYCNK